MAYLWVDKGKSARWLTVELIGDTWVLSTPVPTALGECSCDGSVSGPTLLVRRGGPSDAQWVLLAGHEANVRVNGLGQCRQKLPLSLHIEKWATGADHPRR